MPISTNYLSTYGNYTNYNMMKTNKIPFGVSVFQGKDSSDELYTRPDSIPIGEITKATVGTRWGVKDWCFPVLKKWGCFLNPFGTYDVELNRGVNGQRARDIDVCLAKYSREVADDVGTLGQCYTGVKRALVDSGVIPSYDEMSKGTASKATEYFDKYPEKFKKLDIEEKDLKTLPAGRIIVYKKEGLPGHIAITTGFGQETSDCTDNMEWLNAKGEGSTFSAYELTDRWSYNSETKKLEFK